MTDALTTLADLWSPAVSLGTHEPAWRYCPNSVV